MAVQAARPGNPRIFLKFASQGGGVLASFYTQQTKDTHSDSETAHQYQHRALGLQKH